MIRYLSSSLSGTRTRTMSSTQQSETTDDRPRRFESSGWSRTFVDVLVVTRTCGDDTEATKIFTIEGASLCCCTARAHTQSEARAHRRCFVRSTHPPSCFRPPKPSPPSSTNSLRHTIVLTLAIYVTQPVFASVLSQHCIVFVLVVLPFPARSIACLYSRKEAYETYPYDIQRVTRGWSAVRVTSRMFIQIQTDLADRLLNDVT